MVLSLKRWKSRSSPGFEAGAAERTDQNPFTLSLRVDPGAEGSARPNGRPDPGFVRGRIAKPADALGVLSVSVVAGTGFEPVTFRL